jgi:hypothetical protein
MWLKNIIIRGGNQGDCEHSADRVINILPFFFYKYYNRVNNVS